MDTDESTASTSTKEKEPTKSLVLIHTSPVMRKPVLPFANNKGIDQPAHPRSPISAFVVGFLYSMINLVSIPKMSKTLASFWSSTGQFES